MKKNKQPLVDRHFICPVCKTKVHMNECYYDPYYKSGYQVHRRCLSDRRKQEIAIEVEKNKGAVFQTVRESMAF
jgi:hypothetical protein